MFVGKIDIFNADYATTEKMPSSMKAIKNDM